MPRATRSSPISLPSDTLGALLGPLIAVGLMALLGGDFPGRLLVCLYSGRSLRVDDPLWHQGTSSGAPGRRRGFSAAPPSAEAAEHRLLDSDGVVFLLLLPRFSESMLLLRAQNVGLGATWVPFVFCAMNLLYAPLSAPAGLLSDRIGRRRVIFAGFAMLIPRPASALCRP